MLAFSFADPFNGAFVEVNATGSFELNRIFALIRELMDPCGELECGRALVDLADVMPTISDMERFYAGERVADTLKSSVRLAVVRCREDINASAKPWL